MEVLQAGGFQVNQVVTEIFPLQWADVGDWWEANWSHGYRQVLEALPRWRLEAYRADCFERLKGTRPIRGRLEVVIALANAKP